MNYRNNLLLYIILFLSANIVFGQGNFWNKIGIDESSYANSIYITSGGNIWVGSGATSDGGAVFLSTDDGNSWSSPYDEPTQPGVSALLVIDNNNVLIGTGSGVSGVVKRTTNGGTDWSTVQTMGMFELVTSFVSTSAGIFVSTGVYQNTSGKIYFSNNGGATWSEKTSTLGAVMALAASSSGVLFAGNHYGDIYTSNDDGTTWTKIRTGNDKDIGTISVNSSGHIYIGVENEGIYKTTNNGNVWTQLNNGLGNKQVSAILLVNDNLFFAGTPGDGVFRSINAGGVWTDVTRGLGWHNIGNGALKIYNNYLYCGVGDGVYKSVREATDIPGPPSPPKNLSATNGARIVTLNWGVSDSAGANVVYKLYRKTSQTSYSLRKDSINSSSTQYVDSVRNDVQYYYYMTSYDFDKALGSSSTNEVGGMSTLHDPVPPPAPTNLSGTPGNARVTLRWEQVNGPFKFSVFRGTSSNEYGTAIATSVTSKSYTDNSVTNETRYYYIVKAVNDTSGLSSNASNEISVLPVKPNPEPPSDPQAEADYPNINVWWSESVTGDVTEYRIYRSTTQGAGYQLAGTETAPSNTFIDNTVSEDVTYYYVIKAYDGVHESSATSEVSAMIQKLALKIEVNPSSSLSVDRMDLVVYNITTRDQGDTRISADIKIENGIIGSTDNVQTDENGTFRYEFQIPVDQEFSEYSMSFTATKAGYETAITERIVNVTPIPRVSNDWAIVYAEEGTAKLIFAMVDTNNKWFSPGTPGKVSNDGHDIYVNSYLRFSGDFTLDTNNLEIVSTGKWFVYSPAEPPTEYTFLDGDVNGSYGSSTVTLDYNESNMQNSSSLFGVKIYPDDFGFVGGLVASGVTVDGYFYLPGIKAGCEGNPVDEIHFTNMIFDEDGINLNQMTLSPLSPDPSACFSNLTAMYDASQDKLTLYGDFSIPWLSVKGWGEVQLGNLSTINLFSARGEVALIGETGMTIRNVGGTVSGVNNPPMEMTLDGTIVSASPDYLEIDIGGVVSFPQKIDFIASEVRIILEHTYEQWQIVGPMTGMINVISHVNFDGDIRAGSIEGQYYVLEGTGIFNYQWSPDEKLRGGFKGDVTVTDLPDEFPYDALAMLWDDEFPVKLKNAELWIQDRKVMGNLHFGNLLGSLNFTLDLEKVYGQEGFITVGTGAQNLNGMLRKDWDKKEKVQNYDPYKYEGQSLPMLQRKKEGTQAITNNDTLNLTGGMDKVFIRIMSDTQVPGSSLFDPNGTKHDANDDPPKDTNVVYKQSTNGKKGYWIIKGDFPAGQWIAGSDPDETKPGDYRDVFATFDQRDIELIVTKNQNDVTVEWNNTAVPAGPYLEFYLALDTNDVNGLFVGTADENTGQFNYTLADTLPECLYYLYVLRFEDEKVDKYYSTEELWNNKGNLMPPEVGSPVYYGTTKKLLVSWTDPNTSENIQGYLIRLTYTDGTEKIIARPYAGETNIEIDIDIDYVANPTLEIALAAYTKDGYQSCWSTIQGVAVDVEDYPFAGFENEDDRLSVFPNPVSDATNIRFKVADNGNIKISVYDLLGIEVGVLANDYYSAGIYDVSLKSDKLISGTYYIKYQAGDYTRTKLMIISK
ncbi:MAG: T9SS type A sorting domain-containing protein [bacterium]